jgi:DnaJ homolog subfamily B member 12
MCARIIESDCYYEVLGLRKNCTDKEIQVAYKKVALKIHPDRNRAPIATDAFKKVSSANECLKCS